jgi:hypothetical protein
VLRRSPAYETFAERIHPDPETALAAGLDGDPTYAA